MKLSQWTLHFKLLLLIKTLGAHYQGYTGETPATITSYNIYMIRCLQEPSLLHHEGFFFFNYYFKAWEIVEGRTVPPLLVGRCCRQLNKQQSISKNSNIKSLQGISLSRKMSSLDRDMAETFKFVRR